MSKRRQGLQSLHKGESGEADIIGMFQRWSWLTAKPKPDLGTDLVVEAPSEPGGSGPSILVQVKARSSNIESVTIEHDSAVRLKGSVLPVFLFFLNIKTAKVKWAYVEPLFHTDAAFLAGGPLRIPLAPESNLDLRAAECPPALWASVHLARARGAIKALPSIGGHSRETQKLLSEIDPRLIVIPTYDGHSDGYQIRATSDSVPLSMNVHALRAGAALMPAFDWGREVALEECRVEMQGSPIFQFLRPPVDSSGTLVITPDPTWRGHGVIGFPELVAAGDGGVTHPVEVTLTQGRLGTEMLLEVGAKIMSCRISFASTGSIKGEISVRFDQIVLWRVRDLHKLRGLAQLLKSLVSRSLVRLQLIAHPTIVEPVQLKWGANVPPAVEQIQLELEALEALEYIHRALGVPSVESRLNNFTAEEMEEWLDAAELLKGGRVAMKLVPLRVEVFLAEGQTPGTAVGNFRRIGGIWSIPYQGSGIAEIPVDAHYVRHRVLFESVGADGAHQVLLEPMDGASERYLMLTPEADRERSSS